MVSAWLAMCAGWIASAMRPWLGCWDGACLGVRGTPLCRDVACLCAAPQAGSMTLPVGRKSVLEAVHASEQTPSGELEFKVLAVSSATELSGVSTAPVAGFLHVYVHTPGVFVSLGVWAHVLGACVALAWPKWTVWCAHTCHLHFRLFVLAPWVQDEGEHGGGDVDGPGTLCHCAALSILAVVQDFLDGVGGLGEGPPVRLVVGLPPHPAPLFSLPLPLHVWDVCGDPKCTTSRPTKCTCAARVV